MQSLVPAGIRPFSVLTGVMEKELDGDGFRLRDFDNGDRMPRDRDFNMGNTIEFDRKENSRAKRAIKKNRGVPGFCAMQLKGKGELWGHIERIYGLMYHHYVVAKASDFSFPNRQCHPSAPNVMTAAMLDRYPNASVLSDEDDDHCYTAFPFLMEDEKGFIIADPTSDQLWRSRHGHRNDIFVVRDGEWEYRTDDWAEGNDLYPHRYKNLASLRDREGYEWGMYDYNIKGYFRKVFENPVRVSEKGVEVL
jgi:hypothetical protein